MIYFRFGLVSCNTIYSGRTQQVLFAEVRGASSLVLFYLDKVGAFISPSSRIPADTLVRSIGFRPKGKNIYSLIEKCAAAAM